MDICKDPYYRKKHYAMCDGIETTEQLERTDAEKRRRQEAAELAWDSLSEPEEFVPEESPGEAFAEDLMDFPVHVLARTASAPLTSWLVDWGPINKLGMLKGLGITIPAEIIGFTDYLRDIEQKGWNTLGLHPEQADDIIYDAYGKFKDWLGGDK